MYTSCIAAAGTTVDAFAVQLTLSADESQAHCTEQDLSYQAITTTVSYNTMD